MLFRSDPKTNNLVEGGIQEQTTQVIQNLRAVLEVAGSSLDKVIKTTCFLTDMADFADFNAAYAKYFNEHKPARSAVAVRGLPKGSLVEIECVAKAT